MMLSTLLFLIVGSFLCQNIAVRAKCFHEYCIIGAGPGGLQVGYFLEKSQRDYVIFERSNVSGNFYVKYPRHRKLISINKRYSGQTNSKFRMRHDWNSLLSDNPDLKFTKYTEEFYPKADVLLQYLDDFTKMNKLKVQYNTEISGIEKIQSGSKETFRMNDQTGKQYTCRTVILASGLFVPNVPDTIGEEHVVGYEDVSINPKDFTGKNVLILGRGNAAFETADAILHETNFIHMLSRSRAKLAWSTHYVGDLRAVNNNFLDNYQLKSLDGLLEYPVERLAFSKSSIGKIMVNVTMPDTGDVLLRDNQPLRCGYDVVIRCTGFKSQFSIFHPSTMPKQTFRGKYPKLKGTYESENIDGLYVAGVMSHGVDFRKSAGGFIHGYRYTARTLHKVLESRYHDKVWENKEYKLVDLSNTVIKRLNEADSLYQMFSTLCDVIVFQRAQGTFRYFEDFPLAMVTSFPEITRFDTDGLQIMILNFEYGRNFSGPGKDVFAFDRAVTEASEAHKSNFLHPVLYFYGSLPTDEDMRIKDAKDILPIPKYKHHIVEDFLTEFTAPIMHLVPLRRFFEHVIRADMLNYDKEFCLKHMIVSDNVPIFCKAGNKLM